MLERAFTCLVLYASWPICSSLPNNDTYLISLTQNTFCVWICRYASSCYAMDIWFLLNKSKHFLPERKKNWINSHCDRRVVWWWEWEHREMFVESSVWERMGGVGCLCRFASELLQTTSKQILKNRHNLSHWALKRRHYLNLHNLRCNEHYTYTYRYILGSHCTESLTDWVNEWMSTQCFLSPKNNSTYRAYSQVCHVS